MDTILARTSSRTAHGGPHGPLGRLLALPGPGVHAVLAARLGLLAVAILAAAPAHASGQLVADYVPAPARDQAFDLSIRNIMRGEENVGQAPTAVRWTDDGRWVYFQWQPGGLTWDAGRSLYRVAAGGGEPERVDDVEAARLAPVLAGGDLSPDRRRRVAEVDGDLYLIDRASMDVRRLTRTDETESDPLFSADGASVLFRRGANLHRLGLEGGELTQLTRITDPADDADDDEPQRAFLERQQLEL